MIFYGLLVFIFSTLSHADQNLSTAPSVQTQTLPVRPPRITAQLTSYYLSFQGERAADSQLYDFGRISTRMELLNLGYLWTPKLSTQLTVQHFDSTFESLFPRASRPEWKSSKDRLVGLGDTNLTANYTLSAGLQSVVTGTLGVSLPTGSIDNKNTLRGLESFNMAYNAQLGSGTYDALLGVTGLYFKPRYVLGTRAMATVRTGTNNNGYRLGNQYRLDTWFDYPLKHGFVPRLTAYYRHREGLNGFDTNRGKNSADNFFYNTQINWDVSAALQYKYTWKTTSPLTVIAEVGVPLAQDNINVDNSFVAALFYASLGLSSAF